MKPERLALVGVLLILFAVILPRGLFAYPVWYASTAWICTAMFWIGILVVIYAVVRLMR